MAAYTVTLNKNGGPANGTNSVSATYGSAMPSATMPTRLGYTFAGYYDTSAASGGTQYYTAAGASARTWNKQAAATLYARWTKKNYNLTVSLGYHGQYQVLPYDGKIEHWDNSIYTNLALLAKHGDGYFASGLNDVASYVNNSTNGNGTSTVTRISKQSDNPLTESAYELSVAVSKNANTAYIGFWQNTTSAASQVFTHVFVAKLPNGYYFERASNSTGTNSVWKWLTPQQGTGKYEIYAYELTCGSEGTFSTFGHVYVQPNNTAFDFTFYVAYSEIFNTSRSQVFSIPYANDVTLPKPSGMGSKFRSWCTNYTGNGVKVYGRARMYTSQLSVHLNARMDNWAEYVTGTSAQGNMQMRLISCTEGGGWNIEATDGVHICAAGYDSGVGYKNATSSVEWSSLSSGWHDFDLVFNGTNLKLYLDRELIATSANYTSGQIGYNAANGIFVAGEAEGNETTASSYRFVGQVGNVIISSSSTLTASTITETHMIMPAATTTVSAYWTNPEEEILYIHPNGGLTNTTALQKDTFTIQEVPQPIKQGYNFKGWYYDFDGINYLSLGRRGMWTDKFSVHMDVYEDWSLKPSTNIVYTSCTENGGYSIYRTTGGILMCGVYDSGASTYVTVGYDVRAYPLGWHSIDVVFNGTNIKLYLDDTLVNTSSNFTGSLTYHARNNILMGIEPGDYGDAYGRSPTTFGSSYTKFIGKIANYRTENVDYKLPRDIYSVQVPAQDADVYALWEPANNVKTYGAESHLTDLTNTTWYLNETVSAIPGNNTLFDINASVGDFDITNIWIDSDGIYSEDGDDYFYENGVWKTWGTSSFRTWSITGGTSATNLRLINWLYDNATLQSSPTQWVTGELKTRESSSWTSNNNLTNLTNLTNTTWLLNDILFIESLAKGGTGAFNTTFDINFTSNNETFDIFNFQFVTGIGKVLMYNSSGNKYIYKKINSIWLDDNYKYITITGGDDVQNTQLINWLQENAQIMPKSPQVVKVWNGTSWDIIE